MKGRFPLLALLAGSLMFLASLYLTWVSAGDPAKALRTHEGALSLLNLFSNALSLNGWGAFGQAGAIAAVALGLFALVALVRPELEAALPIGGCALALAVLALVNAADLRTQGLYRAGYDGLSAHLGVGAYVGGAAALAALLGAAWVSHDEISEPRKAVAATLLTIGLVAAYVLPTFDVRTHRLEGSGGFQFIGLGGYGTAVMLLIASFGLTFWFGAGPPIRRVSAAAVVLTLAVGGFSILGTHLHWPYEAWLAIGCAAGLLGLAVATSGQRRVAWPARHEVLALEGAALLLASLFLNWEKACSAPHGGSCFVGNGWSGGVTGGLVAIFVVSLLGFRRLAPELAVTVVLYVLATGLGITVRESLGYGAFLGFAGAALLLLAVVVQLPRNPRGPGVRVVAAAACVAFLAIPVATLTDRLPSDIEYHGAWQLHLLEVAAIVLGVRLIGCWLSGAARDDELLLLPIALLALTGLNFSEAPSIYFTSWEGWLSVALSILLVALGLLGRRGGLDDFRIPDEIWRIDRISTAED